MSDLIDRQAALDAIAKAASDNLADANHYYLQGYAEAAEVIRTMPGIEDPEEDDRK